MSAMQKAVLSEHLAERIGGRRVLAGVFLTYQYDPGFFELNVLPVLFDSSLSHAPPIKLAQLEDSLRKVPHGIAIYYDRNGIVPESTPSRLDIQRIAVCHRTGVFHPKNVFLLVEDIKADKYGYHPQALIVTTLSANLTQSGWWSNVEVCHTEEIVENDSTRLRDSLIGFIDWLKKQTRHKTSDDHGPLQAIRDFLRQTRNLTQKSSSGVLRTHFYDGRTEVAGFLDEVAGNALQGLNLEIISPYFSERPDKLLQDLADRFALKEIRVYLPRDDSGKALCSPKVFENIRKTENVEWARLPDEYTRNGKDKKAKSRFVHAKVYRFFSLNLKKEYLFIGSVNFTASAHQRNGNAETAFFVDMLPGRRPEWMLQTDSRKPLEFAAELEDEGASTEGGTNLSLRFHWDTQTAEAFWDAPGPSPALTIQWQKDVLFSLAPLPSGEWTSLESSVAEELHRVLKSTSVLSVVEKNKDPALILVQEEGMHAKPSVLFDLTPEEILRYWSLLTPAQRAEFLNVRAPQLALSDEGSELLAKVDRLAIKNTFFDRFAGIFLAFGSLERTARESLPANTRDAAYRLFGQKYDSLPNLLGKVIKASEEQTDDPIYSYVTYLCARQVVDALKRDHGDFFREQAKSVSDLEAQLDRCAVLRNRLSEQDAAEMPKFLDWFEPWFLRRAKQIHVEES